MPRPHLLSLVVRTFPGTLLGTLLVVALTAGCTPTPTGQLDSGRPPSPTPAASDTAAPTSTDGSTSASAATGTETGSPPAADVLARIPVKGRAPKTGYSRDQYGQTWTDDVAVGGGHNGCDQRSDVLRRDLLDMVLKLNTQGCVPASGTLHDPYTDQMIAFVRGQTTSSEVQIDHLVALSNAWQTGAQQLTAAQRQNLAGDPLELLAVAGAANLSKGDGDTATWLPSNKAFRCPYVARQIAVKAKYGLWVTAAERAAMQQVLSVCPTEPLPDETGLAVAVPAPQR